MDASTAEKVKFAVYPAAEVEACLRTELLELARAEAEVQGITCPKDPVALANVRIRLDSLSVVDILCSVEPIIGFELRDSLVRTGGYESVDAAVEHLMPRLEATWNKKHGITA